MDILPQALLFIGIIPSLILLYVGLKGYDGLYKDKTVFITFIVGIILGVIAVVIRIYINPPVLLIIYILIFAFFEQLIRLIFLNIGRLQRKRETTIYGFSLGLGFGSVFTPFLIIAAYVNGVSSTNLMALIAFGSIGIILFHGATGAYIGYGIYIGKMFKFLLFSIIIQIPLNVIIDLTRIKNLNNYFVFTHIAIVVYGGIIFYYVVKKIMPRILEKSKKRLNKKTN